MLLTDREIRIALAEDIIRIEPAPNPDAFSSSSVDLTLDSTARVFRATIDPSVTIDPGAPDYSFHAISEALTEAVDLSPRHVLARQSLLLAWTKESVDLPIRSKFSARVEGKSSLARLGLAIHVTAPTIHAGFKGQIQLEIINHGAKEIVLRPGMRICQLIIEATLGTPEKGYSGIFSGQKSR